ncbi:MAG TPA: hypothetical protein VGB26_08840 [Nitrospiria bacterium]|jgi:hypothetical protein
MMILNIEENPNCETAEGIRFKTVGPPRPIKQVKMYDQDPEGTLCQITGWSDDPENPVCPAYSQKVEDSGDGEAFLVFGGAWGLRLKPIGDGDQEKEGEWSLTNPEQWGEAYLILNDREDLTFFE